MNVRLQAGSLATLGLGAANLASNFGDDPESFRPERFLRGAANARRSEIMTFGTGVRYCVGARFARVEALALLFSVLRHWRVERHGAGSVVNAGFWNARPRGNLSLSLAPSRPRMTTSQPARTLHN